MPIKCDEWFARRVARHDFCEWETYDEYKCLIGSILCQKRQCKECGHIELRLKTQ